MRRPLVCMGATVLVAAVGCGSPTASEPKSTGSAAAPTSSAIAAAPATVINVAIAAGEVRPTNSEAQAKVGQPIVLEVSSDATDSIHVHSVPEHVFDVQARPGQRFEFTVGVPGSVDVELHDLNRTIVTIAVRP